VAAKPDAEEHHCEDNGVAGGIGLAAGLAPQVDPASWRARALTPFTRAYLGETVGQEVIRTLGLVNENPERSTAEEALNRDLFPRDGFLSPR